MSYGNCMHEQDLETKEINVTSGSIESQNKVCVRAPC